MNALHTAKRIVIKIGSTLVADDKTGVRSAWLQSLATDIAGLIAQEKQVLIVTSGAVALGKHSLKLSRPKSELRLEQKQAAAACGQVLLVNAYREMLAPHQLVCGQILLSLEDSEDRRRYLNARNTLNTLLEAGIIPVINENDTVATAELRVGDNDRLAARVAQMVDAQALILLSDVDGLFTANPKTDKKARHIPAVKELDDSVMAMADGVGSHASSGGMQTKLDAARIATASGCHTYICNGVQQHPVHTLWEGGIHTHFHAKETPAAARKRWIGDRLHVMGSVIVDDGAATALHAGKSLLPAGVTRIEGEFQRGDCVVVTTLKGAEIARGLIAYNAEDAGLIIGKKSSEIATILGFKGRDALIHRDDLVLT